MGVRDADDPVVGRHHIREDVCATTASQVCEARVDDFVKCPSVKCPSAFGD